MEVGEGEPDGGLRLAPPLPGLHRLVGFPNRSLRPGPAPAPLRARGLASGAGTARGPASRVRLPGRPSRPARWVGAGPPLPASGRDSATLARRLQQGPPAARTLPRTERTVSPRAGCRDVGIRCQDRGECGRAAGLAGPGAGRAGRAADGASNVATPEWENWPSRCWGLAAAVQPS